MEIWLHEGLPDGEPGHHAWGLHQIGFATWAPDEKTVIELVPAKFDEHRGWLVSHQLAPRAEKDGGIQVVERVRGHEILFGHDRGEASVAEIDRTIELLAASRSDLLAILDTTPEATLSWNPPYRQFAKWADWRSIGATLAHLGNSEIHYYTAMIGHESTRSPASPDHPWREFLPATRAETVQFLQRLRTDPGLSRVTSVQRHSRRAPQGAPEEWSVRKALRRMVRHELLHTKSIRRILTEWQRQHS